MKTDTAKLFIKTPPEPKEVKLHKATRERRSKAIWKFLESHPRINVSGLATDTGYTPANFNKYQKDKKILPQHLLIKTESILSKYGLIINNMSEDLYPGSNYQRLFNAISNTIGIPLQSEMDDIIQIVHEDFPKS